MADYKEKLDEWQQAARRKARELDEKYSISDLVGEAAKRGAESVAGGAERLRSEAERLTEDDEISDAARRAANETVKNVKKAGKAVRDVAGDTGKRVYDDAKTYYERASSIYGTGARFTRASAAATTGLLKARDWIKENPGKAAVVSVSLVLGIRAGAAFPGLDAVLLGSHPHWLTHSALPVWGMRKASEKFDDYLKKQEDLIARGELDEAAQQRAEFERKIAKYVGAPLLGAFSVAAGAGLVYEAFTGGVVGGFPINLVLGGNPMLSSIWLFGNGLICFHNGYKFFMMALGDQEDVSRVVRDIKGLLPAGV